MTLFQDAIEWTSLPDPPPAGGRGWQQNAGLSPKCYLVFTPGGVHSSFRIGSVMRDQGITAEKADSWEVRRWDAWETNLQAPCSIVPQTSLTKHKFKDKIIENFTMASVCMLLLRVGPCVTTPVLLEVQQYGWNFVQKILTLWCHALCHTAGGWILWAERTMRKPMGDHLSLMVSFKNRLEEAWSSWDHLVQSPHLTCEEMKTCKGTHQVMARSRAKTMLFCY